ncbi:hypothetical protein [Paenibacillus sp. Root444D2]|uniref:hypothetical protein n=1 Tax=Paenibacillus sp. Root444D2 TaxID=1736538 RepID=UPI00071311BD|nr:hypothetical protein [Paenibacillus sp. Root444D2]KQX46872.1 hypothetical protein ASD40_16465 [Paenibacillus sp. Root444D2]
MGPHKDEFGCGCRFLSAFTKRSQRVGAGNTVHHTAIGPNQGTKPWLGHFFYPNRHFFLAVENLIGVPLIVLRRTSLKTNASFADYKWSGPLL